MLALSGNAIPYFRRQLSPEERTKTHSKSSEPIDAPDSWKRAGTRAFVFEVSALRFDGDAFSSYRRLSDSADDLVLRCLKGLDLDFAIGPEDLSAGLASDNGVVGWVIYGFGDPAAVHAREFGGDDVFCHGEILFET